MISKRSLFILLTMAALLALAPTASAADLDNGGKGRSRTTARSSVLHLLKPTTILRALRRAGQKVRTRWRLHRHYPRVFSTEAGLVVSEYEDASAVVATGRDQIAVTVAGQKIDKYNGQVVGPVRLLRRSHILAHGPSRAEVKDALADFMFEYFELTAYVPHELRLAPGLGDWRATFSSRDSRGREEVSGTVALNLSKRGEWYVNEDPESGTTVESYEGDASFPVFFGLPNP